MGTKETSGVFYCPNCGASRQYRITREVGWSTVPRGYTDGYTSEACPKCGDRTIYEDFGGALFVIGSKCPSCRKKVGNWKYCMHCGHQLRIY